MHNNKRYINILFIFNLVVVDLSIITSFACDKGFYCSNTFDSALQTPCSRESTQYCPGNTEHPLVVGEGYYAVENKFENGGGYTSQERCYPGTYCQYGIRYDCPAGRYGNKYQEIRSLCTGICEEGYYCPPGSVNAQEKSCGDVSLYCPSGSGSPLRVQPGYYTHDENSTVSIYSITHATKQLPCKPGSYCLGDGWSRLCPSGVYGISDNLMTSSCSGKCYAGYYCPIGSKSPTEIPCNDPNTICPEGSSVPTLIPLGYYSLNRATLILTSIGYYSSGGISYPCPAGYYGNTAGLSSSTCNGLCPPGYYCPQGTGDYTLHPCGGPAYYCPLGSVAPIKVSIGYYTIRSDRNNNNDNSNSGTSNDNTHNNNSNNNDNNNDNNALTQDGQQIAPMGYYASGGVLYPCDAGYYGDTDGLIVNTCSGLCSPGYYCPIASISPTPRICGTDNVYCPEGSIEPLPVTSGYYTADYTTEPCPPGYFRNMSLSIDTTLSSKTTIPTSAVFPQCSLCPEGTYKYTNGDDISLCHPCDVKHSVSSVNRTTCECTTILPPHSTKVNYFDILTGLCSIITPTEYLSQLTILNNTRPSVYGSKNAFTRSYQTLCEIGYYCIQGVKYACPPGTYSNTTGLTSNMCNGYCHSGYYCLAGSTTPIQYECGQNNVICPIGSLLPQYVPKGYYSVNTDGSTPTTRQSMSICPLGSFCTGDGYMYPCPSGTYGDTYGLTDSTCSGLCTEGYFCPSGSSSSTQVPCGNSTVYCVRGSTLPVRIHEGFYGIHTGIDASARALWDTQNQTFSVEIVCEEGYYCTGGIKYPCPPGHYGGRPGLSTSTCSGLCMRGHYCPSYILSTTYPDAPKTTIFPLQPHVRANDYICGDVTLYCPIGSIYPLRVSPGYYTRGGSNKYNTTRSYQTICPPGSYCVAGIPFLCPRGRYGNTSGLKLSICTDRCPPGYYCPPGTSQPLQCPEYTYSTGDSYTCNPCPGTPKVKAAGESCRTSRNCCD